MTPFEVVAAVITAFFGLGIAMGVLIVVALPRRRRRSTYLGSANWDAPSAPPEDDAKPPWWQDG